LIEQLLKTTNKINYITILYKRMAIFRPLRCIPQNFKVHKYQITIAKSVMGGQTDIWTFDFTHAFQSFKKSNKIYKAFSSTFST